MHNKLIIYIYVTNQALKYTVVNRFQYSLKLPLIYSIRGNKIQELQTTIAQHKSLLVVMMNHNKLQHTSIDQKIADKSMIVNRFQQCLKLPPIYSILGNKIKELQVTMAQYRSFLVVMNHNKLQYISINWKTGDESMIVTNCQPYMTSKADLLAVLVREHPKTTITFRCLSISIQIYFTPPFLP